MARVRAIVCRRVHAIASGGYVVVRNDRGDRLTITQPNSRVSHRDLVPSVARDPRPHVPLDTVAFGAQRVIRILYFSQADLARSGDPDAPGLPPAPFFRRPTMRADSAASLCAIRNQVTIGACT